MDTNLTKDMFFLGNNSVNSIAEVQANPSNSFTLRSSERGMTLIEILAVIVLLGLIISVVARGVISKSDAAQAQLNVVKMQELKQKIAQYRLEFGHYPSSLQDLMTPGADVRASGKLFIALANEEDLKDIWGNDYTYRAENGNRSYSISSFGADGAPGGEGANQDVTVRP